uniref:G-protein coupled receptors family 1 profile domain-containing protein n=1 Tax=Acrobeloides nanus TaxID=290746 RepID=A0A914DT49_9BILA
MMDFLARPPLLRGRGSHEKIGSSHEKGSYEESGVEGGFDDSLNYSEDNIEGGDNMAMFQNFLRYSNHSDPYKYDSLDENTFNPMHFHNYTTFPKSPTNYVKLTSIMLCNILGALCIFLNMFVIFALLRNRRRVLANVFYVLVLHCAIVDLIRGGCLIAWGMPHLLINNMKSMDDRLMALKINQFTLVILRSCNLLTIFNLLVFTSNEFIVIKYPLHYRRYFRRRFVLIILAISWMISLFFGVGSVFSNFFESAHSVMVLSNGTSMSFRSDPSGNSVTRRETGGIPINVISMIMIFILCYVCLVTVLICYGTILHTIRKFHAFDDKGKFKFDESKRHTQRTYYYSNSTSNSLRKDSSCTQCNGNTQTCEDPNDPNRRCNSHRKWKTHLMSRHKYLIVIGTVLFVDILFLFPYSGIQLVAFLHLNNIMATSHRSTLIRWGLQILIGVHSVCQPLCYFRMNEFRRLACCPKKKLSHSKSFIHTKAGSTDELALRDDPISEHDHVREPLMDDNIELNDVSDEESGESDPYFRTEDLLDAQVLETNWTRIGSSKFRSYGSKKGTPKPKLSNLSNLSGLRSSTERESMMVPDPEDD